MTASNHFIMRCRRRCKFRRRRDALLERINLDDFAASVMRDEVEKCRCWHDHRALLPEAMSLLRSFARWVEDRGPPHVDDGDATIMPEERLRIVDRAAAASEYCRFA